MASSYSITVANRNSTIDMVFKDKSTGRSKRIYVRTDATHPDINKDGIGDIIIPYWNMACIGPECGSDSGKFAAVFNWSASDIYSRARESWREPNRFKFTDSYIPWKFGENAAYAGHWSAIQNPFTGDYEPHYLSHVVYNQENGATTLFFANSAYRLEKETIWIPVSLESAAGIVLASRASYFVDTDGEVLAHLKCQETRNCKDTSQNPDVQMLSNAIKDFQSSNADELEELSNLAQMPKNICIKDGKNRNRQMLAVWSSISDDYDHLCKGLNRRALTVISAWLQGRYHLSPSIVDALIKAKSVADKLEEVTANIP